MLAPEPTTKVSSPATARLAEHANLLQTWLDRPARMPPRWRSEQFARMVDLVRAHLQPIIARSLLDMSYGQENFHIISIGRPPQPVVLLSRNATEVAYAVRWLELERGAALGPWLTLLGAGSVK